MIQGVDSEYVVNGRHGHALGAVEARALPSWRHPLPQLLPRAYEARPLRGRQEGTALEGCAVVTRARLA